MSAPNNYCGTDDGMAPSTGEYEESLQDPPGPDQPDNPEGWFPPDNETNRLAYPYPSDTFQRVGYRTLGTLEDVVALIVAIGAARAEFKEITKSRDVSYPDRNGKLVSYKYATLAAIEAATSEALAKHQVNLLFLPVRHSEQTLTMVALLAGHGAIIEMVFTLYGIDQNTIKEAGGSTTYARRYVTQCVWNIEGDLDADDVPATQLPTMGGGRSQPGTRPSSPRRPPEERPQSRAQKPASEPPPAAQKAPPAAQPASAPEQKAAALAEGDAAWRKRTREQINTAFGQLNLTPDKMRAIIRQALETESPPRFDDMTTQQVGALWDYVKDLVKEAQEAGVGI